MSFERQVLATIRLGDDARIVRYPAKAEKRIVPRVQLDGFRKLVVLNQDGILDRLQHVLQRAEEREGKSCFSVVRLLVVAPQEVSESPNVVGKHKDPWSQMLYVRTA